MAGVAICQTGNVGVRVLIGLLAMAVQAETHIHVDLLLNQIHIGDIAMTGLALYAGPHMRLMAEVDKIGLLVDIRPLWSLVILYGADEAVDRLLALGVFDGEVFVTDHAFVERWETGLGRTPRKGVAELAIDADFLYMDAMGIRHRRVLVSQRLRSDWMLTDQEQESYRNCDQPSSENP